MIIDATTSATRAGLWTAPPTDSASPAAHLLVERRDAAGVWTERRSWSSSGGRGSGAVALERADALATVLASERVGFLAVWDAPAVLTALDTEKSTLSAWNGYPGVPQPTAPANPPALRTGAHSTLPASTPTPVPGTSAAPPYRAPFLIDVKVLDRTVDRYRRGARSCAGVAEALGRPLSAEDYADGLGGAREALRALAGLLERHADLFADLSPAELFELQTTEAREQAARLQTWKRSKGDRRAIVDGGWPRRTPPLSPLPTSALEPVTAAPDEPLAVAQRQRGSVWQRLTSRG